MQLYSSSWWFCKGRPRVETLPFAFLNAVMNAQFCVLCHKAVGTGFLCTLRPIPCVHLPTFLPPSQVHSGSWQHGGSAWSIGVPVGQLGEFSEKASSVANGGFSGVTPFIICRIWIPLLPSENPGNCSPSCSLSLSRTAAPQCPGWNKKEVDPFGVPHRTGEARCSLICSHFLLWEKLRLRRTVLALNCVSLVGGTMFSYNLECTQSQIFFFLFAPVLCWNFSSWHHFPY